MIVPNFVNLLAYGAGRDNRFEIPELEIIAYEKEDIDKLVSFMING